MDNDDWNARLNADANPVTEADLEAELERTTFKPPLGAGDKTRRVFEVDTTNWSDEQIAGLELAVERMRELESDAEP